MFRGGGVLCLCFRLWCCRLALACWGCWRFATCVALSSFAGVNEGDHFNECQEVFRISVCVRNTYNLFFFHLETISCTSFQI